MKPLYICALKSFGDFVIALNAVRCAIPCANSYRPTVLAGLHLRDLAAALGAPPVVSYVGDETWTDVPAAFDVGKRGWVVALRSLLELRQRLASVDNDCTLVFDRIGWRERFIGAPRSLIRLPDGCDNIYLAYRRVLSSLGYSIATTNTVLTRPVRRAIIVPGSRIERKILPSSVIAAIYAELYRRGIQTTLVALEGESIDLPAGIPSKTIPRRFDALVAALKTAEMVVSADSLSAHLGEYHGLPTFVSTPAPNRYWLPQSAHRTNGWATFDELAPLPLWLDRCSDASQVHIDLDQPT